MGQWVQKYYLFIEYVELEEVIFCMDKNPDLVFQTWPGMVKHAYAIILILRRVRQENCELEDSPGYRERT